MNNVPQNPINEIPIYIIGAGGIVQNAHLPAYNAKGFSLRGIYDLNYRKAEKTANLFAVPNVFPCLEDMVTHAPTGSVFDIATPPGVFLELLHKLPFGSFVLLQKPMGENLDEARSILKLCREKNIQAGVNFQLRYAPYILRAREILDSGVIGRLVDIDIYVDVYTPWHLWEFLNQKPRAEILYHSIHYLDLIRSFWNEPIDIKASSFYNPDTPKYSSARTTMILNYGDMRRATVNTSHCHSFGIEKQRAEIKFEGTEGAISIKMGSLINYPQGVEDSFEWVTKQHGRNPTWEKEILIGSWFPDAFSGPMSEVLHVAAGHKEHADNSVEDAIHTMACVEAAYMSIRAGGTRLPEI
jgi:predicted dehydrogenase